MEIGKKLYLNYADVWEDLGSALYEQQDYKKAGRSFQEALRLQEQCVYVNAMTPILYYKLGDCLCQQNEFVKAEEQLKLAENSLNKLENTNDKKKEFLPKVYDKLHWCLSNLGENRAAEAAHYRQKNPEAYNLKESSHALLIAYKPSKSHLL